MGKRYLIALIVGALLLAVGILLFGPRYKEPVYQGKRLSEWLAALRTPRKEAAADAIRQMGSGAVPFLIHELQATDSPLKVMVIGLVQKQRWYPVRFVEANERHERARAALKALGPLAAPAIPMLIERFKDGNIGHNLCGPYEPLAAIGSNSVPALLQAMKMW